MKTASIITIHIGANFGSNLQTIATSEVIKNLGIEPIIVNYIPPRVTWKRFWKGFYKPLKLAYQLYSLVRRCRNIKIYNGFLEKYCNMSKPIFAEDDFISVCPKTDYYITGSDQVWNVKYNEGIDKHYFYDGINGIKIAYASSFGNESITDEEKKYLIKNLSSYKAISVREKSAMLILNEIGLKATHLIDPTLMLNLNDWQKYSTERFLMKPYILVYLPYNIEDKDIIYSSIRKIAEKKQLKVVSFSWGYRKDKYADETIKFASPGDFISLMIHADYVITNSFHGTAFSINLNKQFWVYMPSKYKTRIESLLELCNLVNRTLNGEIKDEMIDEIIDYGSINKVLDTERKYAVQYLKEALL